MRKMTLEPTATAQWQSLVKEAETVCHRHLGEELQSYLVFLLMRFMGRPELAHAVMATLYLDGLQASRGMRIHQLRDVGDQCLLYSGLFPRRAERKLVRVSYFVEIGRSAYHELACSLARHSSEMYSHLSYAFVPLMEVLQTMRAMSGEALGPLHAAELWNDVGSPRALRELTVVTDNAMNCVADSTPNIKNFPRRSH